jgi:hypothetical protein
MATVMSMIRGMVASRTSKSDDQERTADDLDNTDKERKGRRKRNADFLKATDTERRGVEKISARLQRERSSRRASGQAVRRMRRASRRDSTGVLPERVKPSRDILDA